MPFGPSTTRPSTTMPLPTPVPRIAPNTMRAPFPAPSAASESAKQFASLESRSSRPSAFSRSSFSGCPMSQVEFEFFTSPVTRESVPGMPMPTRAVALICFSRSKTSEETAETVAP